MPAIVTNDHRIVVGDYFENDLKYIPTYIFLGRTTAWENESVPPDIDDSVKDKIDAWDEVFALKRVTPSDIVSCAPRIDWAVDTVYDEYTDDANLFDGINPETNEPYKYYVVTDEFNVYKCLNNNYRSASTTKPSGASTDSFQTPDGYVWKYMYTIRSNDAFTFMTPSWMPCYTIYSNDGSSQWLVQQSAVPGTIDNIYVTDGGVDYSSVTPPDVTISGDGVGATAQAEIDDQTGQVVDVIMTNVGSGYTYASATISGGAGAGAVATPIVSPVTGHGADARAELGAVYKIVRQTFQGDENGTLPVGIDYRRAGVVTEPLSVDVGSILVVDDTTNFYAEETIVGQTSGATGTIRAVDANKNYIYVSDITGTFAQSEIVSSQTYNSAEVLEIFSGQNLPLTKAVANDTDFVSKTGKILYVSNREKISRGLNQTEEMRFVIQL
jgi:hypothetical protein